MTDHSDDNPFENIEPAKRCKVDWNEMPGDERVRRCPDCLIHVYNFSTSSQSEARNLLNQHEKLPYTTLYRRQDTRYMARNCPASMLRNVYGPSKNEVWRQLAEEIGAEFKSNGSDSDYFSEAVLEIKHRKSEIFLDTFTRSYGRSQITLTRLTAEVKGHQNFQFDIYPKTIWSDLGKAFGMQDIEVGQPEFDEDFIIKSNHEQKVRRLLSDKSLCHQLLSYKANTTVQEQGLTDFHLMMGQLDTWSPKFLPVGISELKLEVLALIKDRTLLKKLIDIFIEAIDQLERIL